MKMSGADFSAFLDCKDQAIWPAGLYIEEEALRVNGVECELAGQYAPTDVVEILGGSLAWEDLAKDRESPPCSLVSLARRWVKLQTEINVVITIPKDRLDELPKVLKSLNAKVR